MAEQNLANKSFSITIKTVLLTIVAIASFIFGVGIVYSTITTNSKDIAEMKPEVKKIPVIETTLENLIKGQDEIKDMIKK